MLIFNKKSIFYMLVMGVVVLSLVSGCKRQEDIYESPSDSQVSANQDSNNQVEESNEGDLSDSGETSQEDKEPVLEVEPEMIQLLVYYGDENAENIVSHTVEVVEVSPESIIDELETVNVLGSGVEVLGFEEQKENGDYALHLDLSQEFQDQLFQMGTAGEYIIINSVVNTFLDAYDADKIRIRVEGMILESGHAIYDDYLFFQTAQ